MIRVIYWNGVKAETEPLPEKEAKRLASVLVETERACMGRLLGTPPPSTIKKALERNDYVTLLQVHNTLLGDKTRAGKLPVKLKFDYGLAKDGTERTAPLVLPDPPKTKIAK